MSTTQWLGCGAALLALVAAPAAPAAPAPAAGSPLSVIPADTPVVFQLHGIDRTKDRVLAWAKNAVPEMVPMLQGFFGKFTEEGIDGRKFKGLAADGPHFGILTQLPEGGKNYNGLGPVALILRVTSYAEFRDNFLKEEERKLLKADAAGYEVTLVDGNATYFVDRKTYVVMTGEKETATQLARVEEGLEKKLSKEAAQKFLAADLSLYVDMAAVNKTYGNSIQQSRQMIKTLVQAAGAQGDPVSKAGIEMIVGFYDGIFQFVEDAREVQSTIDIRPEGIATQVEVGLEANSPSSGAFKGARPGKVADLGRFPTAQMFYFATGELPSLNQTMRPWLQGIFAGDEKKNKEVKEALDQLEAAGLGAVSSSYSMPMKGLYVLQFKDAAKAVDAQLKLARTVKAGEGVQGVLFKNDPVIKENAQQHRGFKLNSVQVDYDFDVFAKGPAGPQMVAFMKQLMGEQLTYWFGTDGKVNVQVIAKNWDEARKTLDQYLDGKDTLANQQAFADLRKGLPAEVNLVVAMSLTQYLEAIMQAMKPLLQGQGLPIVLPDLKADPKEPAFVGFAATFQAGRAHFDVMVPSSSVADVRRMMSPLLKMIPGVGE